MAESAAESTAAPELAANGVTAKLATDGDGKPAATASAAAAAAAAAAEDPTSGAVHADVKTIGKPGESAVEVSPAGSGGGGEGKSAAVTESVAAAMDIDAEGAPAEAAAAATAAERKEIKDQRMGQEAMVVDTPEKKARAESSPEGKESPASEVAAGDPLKPEDEDKDVEKMKGEGKVEENGGDGEEDSRKGGKEGAKPGSAGKRGRKRKSSLGPASPIASPLSPERTRPTRERKRAERYEVEDRRDKNDTPLEIKQGKGTAFKDIPNVAYKIGKRSRSDDLLHMLHVLLFRRRAKQQTVKHNVLQFSGFVWENEDKDKMPVKEKLDRYTKEGLNQLLDLLDLQKGGKKEEQVHRIMEFLESPHKTTDSILEDKDKKGKKRKSTGSKGRTPKRAKKEGKAKKSGKSKDAPADGGDDDEEEEEDDDDDDAEDKSGLEDETEGKKAIKLKEKSDGESEDVESDEEDDDEVDKDGPASDEDEKVSAKGRKEGKKGSAKKATPVKVKKQTPKKRTPKKDSAKKTPSKKSTPKEKKSVKWKDGSNEEAGKSGAKGKGKGGDSSAEKSKSSSPRVSSPGDKVVKGQPTEEELKEKITELLNGADLKKVSLKNVREQLEKHFKCDLDSRKKSIKEIVYEVIPEDSDE